MAPRTLVHQVDAEDLAWLKACADDMGCSVGEIVRNCIAYTRQAGEAEQALAEPQGEFVDRIDEYEATEPRAEEIEVPPDENDEPEAPQARAPIPMRPRAVQSHVQPSLLDTTALAGGPTPRPGNATRPIGANPEKAFGSSQGDGRGNVLRANMKHLPGFGIGGKG